MAVRTTGAVIGSFVLGVVVAFVLLSGAGYLLPPAARDMYALAIPMLAAIALLFGGSIAASCAAWLMLRQRVNALSSTVQTGEQALARFDSNIIQSLIDVLNVQIDSLSRASDKASQRQAKALRRIRCQFGVRYDNLPEFDREGLILELIVYGKKEDLPALEELERAAVSDNLREKAHYVRRQIWDRVHANNTSEQDLANSADNQSTLP